MPLVYYGHHRSSLTEQAGLDVTLYICIRRMLDSSLGRDTDHSHTGFSWLSPLRPDKCRGEYLQYATADSFQILPNSSSFTSPPAIQRCIGSILKRLLNNPQKKECR
jgi:hypothetical protein